MRLLATALTAVTAWAAAEVPVSTFADLPVFSRSPFTPQRAVDSGSVYLIKGALRSNGTSRPATVILTKDKKTMIFGEAFDTATGQPVTFPVDMQALEGEAAFRYGNGATKLYLFTDPECPYCRKFEALLPSYKERATFYIFLYPLPFHPHAVPVSRYLLSLPDDAARAAALLQSASGHEISDKHPLTDAQTRSADAKLDRMKALADDLGVEGTPALYDEHGTALNWTQLDDTLPRP